MGEMLGAIYAQVNDGAMLAVTNVIGNDSYFFPMLTNNTYQDCDIIVDQGYTSEKHNGILKANTPNVISGYYKLFSNSDVTLICGSQTLWWGIRPGQIEAESSMMKVVSPATGLLRGVVGGP